MQSSTAYFLPMCVCVDLCVDLCIICVCLIMRMRRDNKKACMRFWARRRFVTEDKKNNEGHY